jgi:hypothetical protein
MIDRLNEGILIGIKEKFNFTIYDDSPSQNFFM